MLICGTAAALAAVFFGLLLPLHVRLARAEAQIDVVQAILTPYQAQADPSLATRHAEAQARYEYLWRRWEQLRTSLDTFKTPSAFTGALTPSEEGRIDFKVALFEARTRLQERALEREVTLPADLGMAETIGAEEDAETRLRQLDAVVKLLERCIDQSVPEITRLVPLSPVDVRLSEENLPFARAFPIRVNLACSFEEVVGLLDELQTGLPVFPLASFRAERSSRFEDDPLAVEVVYAGMRFNIRARPAPVGPAEEPGADLVLMPVTNAPVMEVP